MINYWPLIGVGIITIGLALRLNTLLVILTAGVVTGLIADIAIMDILSTLGASFTKNRYMSLFILVLPMIGVLERYGLRQRAETLISTIKGASAGRVIFLYALLRTITVGLGLNLGGHPSMIRPLVAPMAEAAAEKGRTPLSKKETMQIRALSAASDNFGNFFGQLIFIGAGGLLLIKGVLSDNGFELELGDMYVWAIPTGIASLIVFFFTAKIGDLRLKNPEQPQADKE
ncbi:DUF969 domain-containing protein [Desulforhopalus sp. IMCC35007]|uniref:DUF969 domain-containing protein n=1 Tax=Desulforhopalus sp. IMCC35007 TaxID=2569543 RepID=UPI0010ADC8A2|nr:DUF969 domain-containing protein [Desulforhopalus sp. IMCC35007]TKB07194.1 DUF969 domain-containing protein [Desulforhopalus sp. IMCC35007]